MTASSTTHCDIIKIPSDTWEGKIVGEMNTEKNWDCDVTFLITLLSFTPLSPIFPPFFRRFSDVLFEWLFNKLSLQKSTLMKKTLTRSICQKTIWIKLQNKIIVQKTTVSIVLLQSTVLAVASTFPGRGVGGMSLEDISSENHKTFLLLEAIKNLYNQITKLLATLLYLWYNVLYWILTV